MEEALSWHGWMLVVLRRILAVSTIDSLQLHLSRQLGCHIELLRKLNSLWRYCLWQYRLWRGILLDWWHVVLQNLTLLLLSLLHIFL